MGLRLLLALGAALPLCGGSGLDVEAPTIFRGDGAFGQSLAQFAPSSTQSGSSGQAGVLVGAPLHRGATSGTGSLYWCQHRSGTCRELPVTGPPGTVNGSLGLAVAAGEDRALVCAPTVPQTCGENIYLWGFCLLLGPDLRPLQQLPSTQPECPKSPSDVVFLIDGSGSISPQDFSTMKTFIREVMKRFRGSDTQFALVQFSTVVRHHFDFRDFQASQSPERLVDYVRQLEGVTRTATAIHTVLTQTFVPGRGAREGAVRILIVITDGQKYGDDREYRDVIPLADSMRVTRYAIGVGSAFASPAAAAELVAICSRPSRDHLFRVGNFEALEGIRRQLQDRIFSLEGTQSAHSSSFQLEMAQEGFSALVAPEGPVLGAVGAYGWAGGVFVYSGHQGSFLNGSAGHQDMKEGYLGYSVQSLTLGGRQALALGAPRLRHLGGVLLLLRDPGGGWKLQGVALGTQVGSYFGAALLALDPDGDGEAQGLLVGAPLFYGGGSGGRVDVCTLSPPSPEGRLRCPQSLRGHPGAPLGRFGSSLAPLGDVSGDPWGDLAVGAPLEDEGRGALYIFLGTPGGVSSQYSQRISGSQFPSGPQLLGWALSGGRDVTGDLLPDLAVGASGQVLLLRAPPLLQLRVAVTFQPQEVPVATFDCQEAPQQPREVARASVCFVAEKKSPDNYGAQLALQLQYWAALDAGRSQVRATFPSGTSSHNGSLRLGLGQSCQSLPIGFRSCPQDTLTPLELRVTLEATGVPVPGAQGLRPALSSGSELVAIGKLPFKRDCGPDNVCTDDLRLNLSFGGLETLVVGANEVLEVTLRLQNLGEASYGATVRLLHPPVLSYRRATLLQSSRGSPSLRCGSDPPGATWGGTLCFIGHPVLRPGAWVDFLVALNVPPTAELGGALQLVARASSDNGVQEPPEQRGSIRVRYRVFVALTSSPDSTRYLNVSSGAESPPSATVTHRYEVKVLGHRALPFAVSFLVPTALGETPLWEKVAVTPDQRGLRCQEVAEHPGVPDPSPRLQETPVLGCSVATCREVQCQAEEMEPPLHLGVTLGGSLALRWLLLAPQQKLLLQSSARLQLDEGRFSNGGGGALLQIQTELERLETPNPLPLILGGSVGGLLLLGLVALGLHKVGFFRRRYKEKLEEGEPPTTPPSGDPQAEGPPPCE